MVHDVQKVRPFEHPGAGRKRAKATPKGRQVDPTAAARDRAAARRPAAPARSADRASAPDPGQVSPDLGGASRSARRRDEAVVCRGVRDRDLLCAFRHREGRRGRHRAADHSRLRLADLRDAGRGNSCCTNCRTKRAPASAWCARPASAAAIPRRRPRSAITSSITPPSRTCLPPRRPARPMRICPNMSTTTPIVAGGGYALLNRLRSGALVEGRSAEGARRRVAARARRRRLPDGAQMARGARRARTAADGDQRRRGRARHVQGPLSISKPIRIAFSRAC